MDDQESKPIQNPSIQTESSSEGNKNSFEKKMAGLGELLKRRFSSNAAANTESTNPEPNLTGGPPPASKETITAVGTDVPNTENPQSPLKKAA